MKERYKFSLVNDYEYQSVDIPDNLMVIHEFDGDCQITQVLEGFKNFLRGCSFPETLVDRIQYEEKQ